MIIRLNQILLPVWVCVKYLCAVNCPNILLISPEKSLILTSRSFLILTQYRATKDYQDLLIPNSHCFDEKPKFREREGLCLERCHVRSACLILVLVLIQ